MARYKLDTGNSGNDEILVGDSVAEVTQDVLNRYEVDELPAGWTIEFIDDKPTAQKGNYLWRYLELDEIPEIALQLVQGRKPVEVRMRKSADDDWSNEQLVGFRLAEGEYGSVIYFIDAIGGEWLYCQDYREPVEAQ